MVVQQLSLCACPLLLNSASSYLIWRRNNRKRVFYVSLSFGLFCNMKEELKDKVFRYVKEGRIKRIRSALKKHKNINIDTFIDARQRTALHVACLLGEHAAVKVLIENGASIELTDSQGNTPLHFALHHALQVLSEAVYGDLVEPIWLQASQSLKRQTNNDGESARKLRKKFKLEVKKRREDRKLYEEEEERVCEKVNLDREWHEKLFFELGHDEEEFFTNMNDYSSSTEESYDQWSERIARERHIKHFVNTKNNEDKTKSHREETERQARERTRLLQEQHEAYIQGISKKRTQHRTAVLKTQYEIRCNAVFVENEIKLLKYGDIPWPCKGEVKDMIKIIQVWGKSEKDTKRFLRDQQIRWHPDRFLQKCGDRLEEVDREMIMTAVNQLSQGINVLIESV